MFIIALALLIFKLLHVKSKVLILDKDVKLVHITILLEIVVLNNEFDISVLFTVKLLIVALKQEKLLELIKSVITLDVVKLSILA